MNFVTYFNEMLYCYILLQKTSYLTKSYSIGAIRICSLCFINMITLVTDTSKYRNLAVST